MPYGSNESGSNYPPHRGSAASTYRSGKPGSFVPGLDKHTYDTKFKTARRQRDEALATQVALTTNGPSDVFDDHLKEPGQDILEMHQYMKNTYGSKMTDSKERVSLPKPSAFTRDDKKRVVIDDIQSRFKMEERRTYNKAMSSLRELRQGETVDWMTDLIERQANTNRTKEPETVDALDCLIKQGRHLNTQIQKHVDTMTANALIQYQDGNLDEERLDRELVRLLDKRESKTMKWHESAMRLEDFIKKSQDDNDLEEGEIREWAVSVQEEEGQPAKREPSEESIDSQMMAFDLE